MGEQCQVQNEAFGKVLQTQQYWREGSFLKGRGGSKGFRYRRNSINQIENVVRKGWREIFGKVGEWVCGQERRIDIVEGQIVEVGWNYFNFLYVNKKYSDKFSIFYSF